MKIKLDTYIVANAVLATIFSAIISAIFQKKTIIEKDNIIGKIFIKVRNITFYFIGLFQEEIIRIFQNIFKLINLYYFFSYI